MTNAEAKGVKSVGAQEREAYASAIYKEWIQERVDASLDLDRAQLEVDILEKKWDAWREKAWNRRAEMKLV
jgi:hypothetical protein